MNSSDELAIYFNWSCNLLVGEPVATDRYLRGNLKTVKKVALELLERIGYNPQTVYRGIVMKQGNMTHINPSSDFTYLSFSEDKKIADIFADPYDDMSRELLARGDKYGYTMEYTPRLDEIVFHHNFLEIFPYREAILIQMNIDCSRIHEQKEVTILQPNHPLILNKYDKTNPANL